MKKTGLLIAAIFIASFINVKAGHVSFNYFYSTLAPQGEWISLDYDLMVWRPTNVNYNWSPYSIGRWVWTEDGWYWDSHEPFGWAVYHYGRWHYDDFYGWVWVPDYEWAPAWVEWRYNDDYLGWAPLPPYASFRVGVGISFSVNWHLHNRYWNFVPYNHFCNSNVNVYIINNSNNNRFFNTTKVRTNYYSNRGRIVNGGIDRAYVERKAGYKIRRTEITRVSDHNTYERIAKSRSGEVTAFRPDEKETSRYREVEKYNVRSSEGRTSLQKDKVAIKYRDNNEPQTSGSSSDVRREVNSGRNIESKSNEQSSGTNTRGTKEYSNSPEKYSTESKTERKQVNSGREVKSSTSRNVEKQSTTPRTTVGPKKENSSSRSNNSSSREVKSSASRSVEKQSTTPRTKVEPKKENSSSRSNSSKTIRKR